MELRLPLEMSPGREAACRAVFGTCYIKVANNKIEDVRWKTYGCASAIASTSALSELAKGKSLEEALEISAKDIDDYLGTLPKHKFHCSVLGHQALADAIKKYRSEGTE